MEVVAYLSPALLAQLRVVLGQEHTLLAATSWEDLGRLVRRNPADVAVVDPTADGGAGVSEISALGARHPSLPMVLYMVQSPASFKAVVELAKQGLHQVVLHRFDDEPRRFQELLRQQPADAITEQVLAAMAGPLTALPAPLAREIRRMFRRPQLFWSAQDLADSAGLPRRTMYRQLEGAGFTSPRLLVQGARLLRAYVYLRDPGNLVEDVMTKLKYGSPRIFIRHAREATGLSPSVLRHAIGREEFVSLLVRRLLAPAAGTYSRHGREVSSID